MVGEKALSLRRQLEDMVAVVPNAHQLNKHSSSREVFTKEEGEDGIPSISMEAVEEGMVGTAEVVPSVVEWFLSSITVGHLSFINKVGELSPKEWYPCVVVEAVVWVVAVG